MFKADDLLKSAEEISSHRLANLTQKRYEDVYNQYIVILPLIQGAPDPTPINEEKILMFLEYKHSLGLCYNSLVTLKRCLCGFCRNHGLGDFSTSKKIRQSFLSSDKVFKF